MRRFDTAVMHITNWQLIVLFGSFVCSGISAYFAFKRNRSAVLWTVLGFLYPLLGVTVIANLPALPKPAPVEPHHSVVAEVGMLVADARITRKY